MDDSTNQTDHHKSLPKVIILSVLLIIILLITFLTLQRSNRNEQMEVNSDINPTAALTAGIQKVQALQIDSPQVVLENEDITLTIKVDSKNRDITAFDILVNYDMEGLTYVKSESLIEGFNLYDYQNGNTISVTGIKTLTNKAENIFNQTPIIKVTFKPLKKGSYTFSIPSEVGSEKTQLVDNNSQIMQASDIQTTVTVN